MDFFLTLLQYNGDNKSRNIMKKDKTVCLRCLIHIIHRMKNVSDNISLYPLNFFLPL